MLICSAATGASHIRQKNRRSVLQAMKDMPLRRQQTYGDFFDLRSPPAMRHARAASNSATGIEITQIATIPFAQIVIPASCNNNSLGSSALMIESLAKKINESPISSFPRPEPALF
jgi:hypothetical protein